ncbi:hypothetical protein J3E68DRAFT_392462 [Trichoderma sp. SZMC 28012]
MHLPPEDIYFISEETERSSNPNVWFHGQSAHFNPRANLQIHGRLNRLGKKHAVMWHCLKVKNSFHDHQDRVMLTKWARLLYPICSITGREDGDIAGQYCPRELDTLSGCRPMTSTDIAKSKLT